MLAGVNLFGYVRPLTNELKVIEYEQYKGVYCGLCKRLSKEYGPFARMTLSYDFTVLSMFYSAVNEQCSGFKNFRCGFNPLKKRICFKDTDASSFAAAAQIIMLYFKVKDDILDSKFFKSLLSRIIILFVIPAKNSAKKQYKEMYNIVETAIVEQNRAEDENCSVIDLASQPTANALGSIFSLMTDNSEKKSILYKVGYFLGRWVYLLDAADDLEKDIKNKSYNPFIFAFNLDKDSSMEQIEIAKKSAFESLNLTASCLSEYFEELKIEKFNSILTNIIYNGLYYKQNEVYSAKKQGAKQWNHHMNN